MSNRRRTVLNKVSKYDNGKPNKLGGASSTRRCCNSDQREDYHMKHAIALGCNGDRGQSIVSLKSHRKTPSCKTS